MTTEDGYILELHRIPGPRMVDASIKKRRAPTGGPAKANKKRGTADKGSAPSHVSAKRKRQIRGRSAERKRISRPRYRGKRSTSSDDDRHNIFASKLKLQLDNRAAEEHNYTENYTDYDLLDILNVDDNFTDLREYLRQKYMLDFTAEIIDINDRDFDKISRTKRSVQRNVVARNRELIMSMDPRVIIHRGLNYRRQNQNRRAYNIVQPTVKSADVNSKRSISVDTPSAEAEHVDNNNNTSVPLPSSLRCADLAAECSNEVVFGPAIAASIDKKMLACEKLRVCSYKYYEDDRHSDSRVFYPTGDPLITDDDSDNNYKNNEIDNDSRDKKHNNTDNDRKRFKNAPNKKKKVVFIQHCLQCSSADFVLNDYNEALGKY